MYYALLLIQNHRYHAVCFRTEYSQLNLIAISQCIKILVYHPALVYTVRYTGWIPMGYVGNVLYGQT